MSAIMVNRNLIVIYVDFWDVYTVERKYYLGGSVQVVRRNSWKIQYRCAMWNDQKDDERKSFSDSKTIQKRQL